MLGLHNAIEPIKITYFHGFALHDIVRIAAGAPSGVEYRRQIQSIKSNSWIQRTERQMGNSSQVFSTKNKEEDGALSAGEKHRKDGDWSTGEKHCKDGAWSTGEKHCRWKCH